MGGMRSTRSWCTFSRTLWLVQLMMAFIVGFLVHAFWRMQADLSHTSQDGSGPYAHHMPQHTKRFLETFPNKNAPMQDVPLASTKLSSTTTTISLPSTIVAIGNHSPINHYWDYCGGESSCPKLHQYGGAELPADEQFLLFDSHGAGWNNERQSLEVAYALAFVWRRTLVLPEWLGNPCDPNSLEHVNSTYDVKAMSAGLKVKSAIEFIDYAKAHPYRFPGGEQAVARLRIQVKNAHQRKVWTQFRGWLVGLEGVVETLFTETNGLGNFVLVGAAVGEADLQKMQESPQFLSFAGPHRGEPLALSEAQARATALHIGPRKLLGNFYSKIFVPNPMIGWQLRNTVRRALHLHPLFFDATVAALEAAGMTPGRYGAIHNRQGDFQKAYKAYWLDPKNPQRFLSQPGNLEFLKRHGRIYLAVKAYPAQMKDLKAIFLPALQNEMPHPKQIITLTDKVRDAAAALVGHIKGWQGIVDMAICAQGEEFIGSWASTFTGYIHRLRGYMPFIFDKRMRYTASPQGRAPTTFPSWNSPDVNVGMITWMREWPEGYQL